MNIKNIYKFIGIVIFCILTIIIGARFYLKNILTCQITEISVDNILEYPGGTMTVDDFLSGFSQDFGLDENDENNIRLDPQKYKIVCVNCDIKNKSNLISLSNIGITAKYNNNLSKIIVGKLDTIQSDDTPLMIQSKDNYDARFQFIVKSNDKNDKILEYVNKSSFTLDGVIWGINKHIKVNIDSKK